MSTETLILKEHRGLGNREETSIQTESRGDGASDSSAEQSSPPASTRRLFQRLDRVISSLFSPQVGRHLEQRFGADPFSDEAEIKALLPAGKGGASGAQGARQGLVPRSRSIKGTTAHFLLRVKRTFSCMPTCLR